MHLDGLGAFLKTPFMGHARQLAEFRDGLQLNRQDALRDGCNSTDGELFKTHLTWGMLVSSASSRTDGS